jgi:hypothetical protein
MCKVCRPFILRNVKQGSEMVGFSTSKLRCKILLKKVVFLSFWLLPTQPEKIKTGMMLYQEKTVFSQENVDVTKCAKKMQSGFHKFQVWIFIIISLFQEEL